MTLAITQADFGDPALHDFLTAHLADMAPTAPAESRHALDLGGLQQPHVQLWVAHLDDELVGTAALSTFERDHAEVKSMRTDPAVRGRGVASALLVHTLNYARAQGVSRVSLETGSMDFFAPARALYARHGFVECAPFGAYRTDPNSVFMTRNLTT